MTPSTAPVTRRVRAYFAPVNRAAAAPTFFDPAQLGRFPLQTPPAPWIDLGWIAKFVRKSGTKVDTLRAGAPAIAIAQVRTEVDATVSLEFETWGKLQSALASGSQQTNLLTAATGAAPNGSGGLAAAPVPLIGTASTAIALNVGAAAAAAFTPGSLVAVDIDYTGQTGYIGSGISAAYVQSAASVGPAGGSPDINYIRRVSLNVGVVASIANGILELALPLPAGAPTAGMQVSQLAGFCDREGASFFQEWSALFILPGTQGDRILYHYPRLQAMQPSAEALDQLPAPLATPLQTIRLAAAFRALPVKDANDGETVLCFRSYLPAPLREI
jgi:hypothetical protein